MPNDWEFTVANTALPAVTCSLRPEVMASGGGSLVVEERFQHPRTFRVHWAGAHTSDGTADCGNSAELVLSSPDLVLLSNAVGGAGVEHKTFAGF